MVSITNIVYDLY